MFIKSNVMDFRETVYNKVEAAGIDINMVMHFVIVRGLQDKGKSLSETSSQVCSFQNLFLNTRFLRDFRFTKEDA
jgi:hypothetical protein